MNLFKYYAPKYREEENLSFYEKEALFFQQPRYFNDPWDCKPPILTRPISDEILEDFFNAALRLNTPDEEVVKRKNLNSYPRNVKEEMMRRYLTEGLEKTRATMGIFSMSFMPACELLWAHYAEKHTGYMLHFQINTDSFLNDPLAIEIGVPIPVVYHESREPWDIESFWLNQGHYTIKMIQIKSDLWKYERELRILNPNNNGFLKIPEGWLKSIIIGLETEQSLKDKLIKIGKEMNLSLFYCAMNPCCYGMNIPGLGFDTSSGEDEYQKSLISEMNLLA